MIDAFDLPAIGRSAARFDFAKLENLNGHYIRQADDRELVSQFESVLDYVPDGAELKAKLNDTTRAPIAARDAEPEGARQDPDRADIGRLLHLCRPPARRSSRRRPPC